MDGIIINELSLNGQFNDGRDFWTTAMPPFHKALQDALSLDVKLLFKRSSFYGALATPDRTIHSLLIDRETRTIDEARRYKSALARAINDPFWDEEPRQDYDSVYITDGNDVSGSSVAEAADRPSCLLSFVRSRYEKHPVVVSKNGTDIAVNNIWKDRQLHSIMFANGDLSLEKYAEIHFKDTKLNFSKIDSVYGFSLIDNENQSEFIDSFYKFATLDWPEIATDKGLDYKDYSKNRKSKRYFSNELWLKGVKKFRVTRRNRCFGFVENGVFYVLRFDVDHELSNLG